MRPRYLSDSNVPMQLLGGRGGGGAAAAHPQQMSPQQQNAVVRNLILRGGVLGNMYYPPAVDMWQQLSPIIPSGVGPGSVITIPLRNVGLVKRLVIELYFTIAAGATSIQYLGPMGLSKLISNVQFIDLGNNTRLNTDGWHLQLVSSVKRRRVFGAAHVTDNPHGYGSINLCQYGPGQIPKAGATRVWMSLEVPFVKSNHDLRGAIFADVTNATMTCQITLNPQMFATFNSDHTNCVYYSGATDLARMTAFSMQVNQNYLDQLPRNPQTGAPLLPSLDIGTAYLLNTTSAGLPVANQDNAIAFVNARQYESLAWYFNNGGILYQSGSNDPASSDLNYVAITSANFTNILKFDGFMLGLMGRDALGIDFPRGTHYLDFRSRPISTDQFGNMQFIFNPSKVNSSNAVVNLGWESYGVIGVVNQGGALPSGF